MPLIDCPECGAKISDQAASCPQCGHPMKKPNRGNGHTLSWVSLAVVALVLGLFALISTCKWKPV